MPSPRPIPSANDAAAARARVGAVYGYEVRSEMPLRRLPADRHGPRGTLHVRRRVGGGATPPHAQLVLAIDDGPRFRLWRAGGCLQVESAGSGAWCVDPLNATVACTGVPTPIHEHHLWGVVVPLLLAERGDITFHASAVVADGRCIAFMGHSGRGKSTTAAAALYDAALSLVSEEALVLSVGSDDQAMAWPGPIGLRLLPDAEAALAPAIIDWRADVRERSAAISAEHKVGVALVHRLACDPAPLHAVCLLGPPVDHAETSIERLRAVVAVPQLLPHTIASPDRLPATVRALAALVERTPVYRVRFPRGLAALPRHVRALLDAMLADPAGQHR